MLVKFINFITRTDRWIVRCETKPDYTIEWYGDAVAVFNYMIASVGYGSFLQVIHVSAKGEEKVTLSIRW